MERIVIVGAGQAGAACASALRRGGFAGAITLIGEECIPPYQRPPLSKGYLLGEVTRDRLYLRPESHYAENGIDLLLDTRVESIDRTGKVVVAKGRSLPYDALVLTTGSVPRRLPAAMGGDLRGVHVVRTVRDVDAMARDVVEGGRALIVGGGYIGLEAAAVCRRKGMDVVLIEMADRILNRVAAPETSEYFRALHRRHGVRIREGVGLTRLTGADRRVSGAVLSDMSEVPVDLAVAGIGIAPATALAEGAGLDMENGIRVDARGQTSDPAIHAAGDCASFPYRGRRIRLESVQNAIDQAEAVAATLLGRDAPYAPCPWFWSDQYDVKLQIAGLNTGHDRVVVRDGGSARSHWYYEADTLLAVDAMNDARGYMVGKRLIEAGKSPDAAAVADPGTDLKSLLRA